MPVLLVLLLFFCSCGREASLPETETVSGDEETASQAETLPVYSVGRGAKTVSPPLDLRQAAVDAMYEMAGVVWSPASDMDLSVKNSYDLIYKKGTTYSGLPYNSWTVSNAEWFSSLVSGGVYNGPFGIREAPGVHCSSAVRSAWQDISNSISFTLTIDMLPDSGTGVLAVGEYARTGAGADTGKIMAQNTAETIYSAYALAKKGDAVLSVWTKTGHVRMLSADPATVRSASGRIDPARSIMTLVEQTNSFSGSSPVETTWRVDKQYAFKDLYKGNYIPVTVPELASGKAGDAVISLTGEATPSSIGGATMLKGMIKANYRLKWVEATVKNEEGKTLLGGKVFPENATDYILSDAGFDFRVTDLPAGRYVYTVSAKVGFGEVTLVSFAFEK